MPDTDSTLVRVGYPERGDLVELVQAPGSIEPETNVELSARISARIVEMPFDEGDMVQPDDMLVKLDASDYEARLRGAQARRAAEQASYDVAEAMIESQRESLKAQRATLRQLNLDLARKRELLSTKDVAETVVEELEARVEEATARLSAAVESLEADELGLLVRQHNLKASEADIDRLEDELNYAVIRSPIAGVVTKVNAEVGELVMTGTMNNAGTVILEVADLTRMLLIAEVDESDVGAVQAGQKAKVRINAYPDRVFDGEVQFVALTHTFARDGSKYFRTEILLDTGGDRIYSGLTADVEIETRRHDDVLMVPSQAVLARPVDNLPLKIRENNPDVDMTKTYATVVYRYVDHEAVVTPVTIGAIDLTDTVILSGLSEDDQVVVGPYKVLENIAHDQTIKDELEKKAEDEAKEKDADSEGSDESVTDSDAANDSDDAASDESNGDDEAGNSEETEETISSSQG